MDPAEELVRSFSDGQVELVGRDGTAWRLIADWLDPEEVDLVRAKKALVFVEWCESWERPARSDSKAWDMIVSVDESDQIARRSGGGNVVLSSLWQEIGGERLLIVLSEADAKKRKQLMHYSRLPDTFK